MSQWKEIPGFTAYEASPEGGIRNKKTKRDISLCPGGDGYLYVTMRNNGKYVRRSVHRLVALTFIPNPEEKRTVNHKDKCRSNNHVDNLEWATYSEQIAHAHSVEGDTKYESLQTLEAEENEEWRTCDSVNFEVSNIGRVKSNTGKIRAVTVDGRGYCFVSVGGSTVYVHRLVAEAFIGLEKEGKLVVNHIDGNKSNNRVKNLEVVTQSANVQHAYNTGLASKENLQPVIQVDYKGNIIGEFKSITEASNCTGVNRGCIFNAIHGDCTSHGYRWFVDKKSYESERDSGQLLKQFFKVLQVNDNGDIVKVFNSYPEANDATGVSKSNISRACKKGYKAGDSYWFQCYQDYLDKYKKHQ